jgi:hypothetical protein
LHSPLRNLPLPSVWESPPRPRQTAGRLGSRTNEGGAP